MESAAGEEDLEEGELETGLGYMQAERRGLLGGELLKGKEYGEWERDGGRNDNNV